jgi:hypothetical protein
MAGASAVGSAVRRDMHSAGLKAVATAVLSAASMVGNLAEQLVAERDVHLAGSKADS